MTFPKNQTRRRNTLPEPGHTLYFAYGSNLFFDQMAKRCPCSRFVGRARLYKYSFQINQRGFANVVETGDPRNFVEGLCYRLTASDERSLDRSEGVPTAYQKKELEVSFFPAAPELLGRDVVDIVHSRMADLRMEDSAQISTRQQGKSGFQPSPATESARRSCNNLQTQPCSNTADPKGLTDNEQGSSSIHRSSSMSSMRAKAEVDKGIAINAMVYLSTVYVNPDRPWDEYIKRMKYGLEEALQQGISFDYLNTTFQRWLKVGKGIRPPSGERSVPQSRGTRANLDSTSPMEHTPTRKRHAERDSELDRPSWDTESMGVARESPLVYQGSRTDDESWLFGLLRVIVTETATILRYS